MCVNERANKGNRDDVITVLITQVEKTKQRMLPSTFVSTSTLTEIYVKNLSV